MTISANTPARRTPLQVAEADLLEAEGRVQEQTTRIKAHENQLARARAKCAELVRFRDWRAGNPLLDDSEDAKIKGIRQRAGAWAAVIDENVEDPDLADVTGSPMYIRSVQLAQAHVPGIGEYVTILVDDVETEGTVEAVRDDDGGRVWVDVVVPRIGTLRALLVTPPEDDSARAMLDEKG